MLRKSKTERAVLVALLMTAALAVTPALPPVQAQPLTQAAAAAGGLQVPLHKSRIVQIRQPVSRVSVGNPEIADILILQAQQVYIVGKSLGTTNVVLWGRDNRVISTLDVEVTHDLDTLKLRLHELLGQEPIQVRSSSGTIVLSGEVSSLEKMDAALRLATSFLPEGEQVVNLMQVGGAHQVLLEIKVAEINRTLTRRLGINFNAINPGSRWKIGAVSGGARFPDALFDDGGGFGSDGVRVPVFGDPNPIGPAIDEFAPNDLSIVDKGFFASFLSGDFLFNAVIDAAKINGLAKVLAEPTLTTLTGQEAEFLSGGEFPVPVPQEDRTAIEFKEFGVGVRFLPVVLDSGKISLKINVKVSQISSANSVLVGVANSEATFVIPSLSSRSATSTIELQDGQTMAIAGLISEDLRESVDKFPGLGDIPIIGLLFRSQEFIKGETELVIFATPRLARPTPPELVRLPTDAFVEPSDLEFYLLGRMEGRRPKTSAPPPAALPKGGAEGEFGHEL